MDDLTEDKKTEEGEKLEICGNCFFKFPEVLPIPVPVPPGCRPTNLLRPGMAEMMPMCLCQNPDSPYFYIYRHPKGGCDRWKDEEIKKETDSAAAPAPAPESKIIVN